MHAKYIFQKPRAYGTSARTSLRLKFSISSKLNNLLAPVQISQFYCHLLSSHVFRTFLVVRDFCSFCHFTCTVLCFVNWTFVSHVVLFFSYIWKAWGLYRIQNNSSLASTQRPGYKRKTVISILVILIYCFLFVGCWLFERAGGIKPSWQCACVLSGHPFLDKTGKKKKKKEKLIPLLFHC